MHLHTPTLHSPPLSALLGTEVWLKLENLQPSGSFKLRGVGLACRRAVERGARRLVSSSGGNAGLAVAFAGRALGVPVTVVVPETTKPRMRDLLAAGGAAVEVHGAAWDEAHARATALAADGGALIHPFDHPDLWEGHASLIAEAAADAPAPDRVVVAVGGGGLLCGVLEGMRRVGWTAAPVVACETAGAASYAAALAAGRPVAIPRIDTVATSLGARRVCDRSLAWATEHAVRSFVCDDRAAIEACAAFLDDHRMLVEPACGAALAAVYGRAPALAGAERVLVVVCGGAGVTRAWLEGWVGGP